MAALEDGLHFEPVAVGERAFEAVQLVLIAAERAQDFVAVLLENGFPQMGIARRDARGVAQSGAGVVAPTSVVPREVRAECRGEDLREVADLRDDLIVRVGRHGGDIGPEGGPECDGALGGGGIGLGERGDEDGAPREEIGAGVFPAGFFRAGHRMGADELGAISEGRGRAAANFPFHTADVGDQRAGREVRRDGFDERDDAVHGGADDDDRRVAHGVSGRVGDRVAPRLAAQLEPDLGASRPDGDPLGRARLPNGLGDRSAEQAGRKDGEMVGHTVVQSAKRQLVEPAGETSAAGSRRLGGGG